MGHWKRLKKRAGAASGISDEEEGEPAMQQAMYFQDEYLAKRFRVVSRLIVERASDVVTRHTQTNRPEWWKIGRFFESVSKCSLKKKI